MTRGVVSDVVARTHGGHLSYFLSISFLFFFLFVCLSAVLKRSMYSRFYQCANVLRFKLEIL